ncbi:hypothetical protein [Nonomuraea endophytica]|uniref:hypothetical protein n=1 Tax=Nonomuraea endophytica TaxID=714136 RepID=UPI0037CBE670
MTLITIPNVHHLQLPTWDQNTDQLVMVAMIYEPARDPHFIRIELEDWPVPLDVPLQVLTAGMEAPAWSAELAEMPVRDNAHVLWSIRWNYAGDEQPVELRLLRVPREPLSWLLVEVTQKAARSVRMDWDGAYKRLCLEHE